MSFAGRALQIHAGVIVWAMHFAAIYGFTALACARGLAATAVTWTVAIASTVAAAACIGIALAGLRAARRFESWLSAALAGMALVAIAWETLPVLTVPACA